MDPINNMEEEDTVTQRERPREDRKRVREGDQNSEDACPLRILRRQQFTMSHGQCTVKTKTTSFSQIFSSAVAGTAMSRYRYDGYNLFIPATESSLPTNAVISLPPWD